jgi:hypothetical protein
MHSAARTDLLLRVLGAPGAGATIDRAVFDEPAAVGRVDVATRDKIARALGRTT